MVSLRLQAATVFAENASLNAVVWLLVARKNVLKILWIIVMIGSLSVLVLHSHLLISTYLSYETSTKTSLRTNQTLQFPGITVCNLNAIKKKNLECTTLHSLVKIQINMNSETRKFLVKTRQIKKMGINDLLDTAECSKLKERLIENIKSPNNTKLKDQASRDFWVGVIIRVFNATGSSFMKHESSTETPTGYEGSGSNHNERRKRDVIFEYGPKDLKIIYPKVTKKRRKREHGGEINTDVNGDSLQQSIVNKETGQLAARHDLSGNEFISEKDPDYGFENDYNGYDDNVNKYDMMEGYDNEGFGMNADLDLESAIEERNGSIGIGEMQTNFTRQMDNGDSTVTSLDNNITSSDVPGWQENVNFDDTNDGVDYGYSDYGNYNGQYGIEPGYMEGGVPEYEDYDNYDYMFHYNEGIFENFTDIESFGDLISRGQLDDLSDLRSIIKLNPEELTLFGYTAQEFIIECSFDRSGCSYSDFFEFPQDRYGRCYTFNSGFARHRVKRTRRHGSSNGLRLTLNIKADEYIGFLASEYGVRVSVHDPNISPRPESQGISAGPGYSTSVGMRYSSIKRLEAPYESNCTSTFPPQYSKFTSSKVYTIEECQSACKNSLLHERCNCVEMANNRGNISRCDMLDNTDRKCLRDVYNRLAMLPDESSVLECYCPPPCNEVNYDLMVSQVPWPTKAYMELQMRNFLQSHKSAKQFFKTKEDNNEDYVRKNLVRLKIHFEAMNYHELNENPRYTLQTMAADIGGILGLYMGISLITLFELVQLLATCMCPKTVKWYQDSDVVVPIPKSAAGEEDYKYYMT